MFDYNREKEWEKAAKRKKWEEKMRKREKESVSFVLFISLSNGISTHVGLFKVEIWLICKWVIHLYLN